MKKLFTLIALVAVALGASAQKSLVVHKMMKPITVQQLVKAAPVKADINRANRPAVVAKAVAADSVSGDYIEVQSGDPIGCVTANVAINGTDATLTILGGFAIAGTFDPETGNITVAGEQEMPAYDYEGMGYGTDYGKQVFYPFNNSEDGENIDMLESATYVYDAATGNYAPDCDGMIIMLPDYEGGAIWTYGYGENLLKPNASMFGANTWNATKKWAWETIPAYVEEEEGQVLVYNFASMGVLTIYANEDLTVEVPNLQLLEAANLDEGYGEGFYFVNCTTDEEGYIHLQYDESSLHGTLAENAINLYDVKGFDNDSGVFGVFSLLDDNGAGYRYGYGQQFHITLLNGVYQNYVTGIKEVKSGIAQQAKDRKCYNVLGQKTTRNAKGIVIANGKKFFNK